jgi:hypothetical protein
MAIRTRPNQRDDLFVIFPDLPWRGRRNATAEVDRVRRQVRLMQAHARENIKRQRAATERMRMAYEIEIARRRRR